MATMLVTGGSGFIGRNLCQLALSEGWQVIVLTRDAEAAAKRLPPSIRLIERLADLEADIAIQAVVNLAGKPLAEGRWTRARKRSFIDSRIAVTQQLYDYFSGRTAKPKVIISGSAVGYYGPGKMPVDEMVSGRDGFSHRLCRDWEASAGQFANLGCRVCCLRTGIVLGAEGALAKMLPAFKLALGGPMGTGKQWMSWIHIEDMARVIMYCILKDDIVGAVNATAPNPVTNQQFSKALGASLGRPAIFTMPALIVKLMFGEMGDELLLQGQSVLPKKLKDSGFDFKYARIDPALSQLLG
ncbi:MAG: TIGR01777 family oxidoreductase [Porticoccaceae bacterium]|nr:TIGR01777 family oxidoreductase [Porticoccaceae bacterium]